MGKAMGSVIYEFLTESLLFDEALIEENFLSIPESELQAEVDRYREFSVTRMKELIEEVHNTEGGLKVFGAEDYFSIAQLKQTALYLDQVIIPDPIFPYSYRKSDASKTMSQFLGMERGDAIDKRRIAEAVTIMKDLTPMVVADYLKFFPISYYFEPDEQVPVGFSENYFADVLPSELLKIYHERAKVRSLKKADIGWIVEDKLKLGRSIAVQFEGDCDNNIHMYNLFEPDIQKINEEERIVHFAMTLPDEPPPLDLFRAWVYQSVNKAAQAHYEKLIKEYILSSKFGSYYLTTSQLNGFLLGQRVTKEKGIKEHTMACVLNLDLPFFSNISISDIMKVRENEGEAFELFRKEFEKKLRGLRRESDPEIIKSKMEDVLHELGEVQVVNIEKKIKHLRRGALAEATIALGGLAGSVITSGLSLAATIIALASGCKTYSEYQEKVKDNPAYFLWKIRRG